MRRVAQRTFVYFWTCIFVSAGIVPEGSVSSCCVEFGVDYKLFGVKIQI